MNLHRIYDTMKRTHVLMKSQSVSHTFLSSYFAPLITLTGRTVKLWGEDCQKKRSFLSTHNIYKNCMSTKGRRTTKTNLIILLLEAKKSFTLEKYPQQTRFSRIEINDNDARLEYQDDERQGGRGLRRRGEE